MESAPRDGTRIVGWYGDRAIVVFWRSGPEYVRARNTGNVVWYWSDGYSRFREADCWQAEPSPPNAAEFPSKEPPPKPRGPTTVVASPAARRRIVEKPKRQVLAEQVRRTWCTQCEFSVTTADVERCSSPFCKLKVKAA